MNYCDENIPFTRITEHKYFNPNSINTRYSVGYREFSSNCGINDEPYYPIRFTGNTELIDAYYCLAYQQQNVSFLGRLGTFRYMDMDKIIEESIQATNTIDKCNECGTSYPVFLSDIP
jgi:UDP-galactopyranose mutase